VILLSRKVLVITDSALVVVITLMSYNKGGIDESPLILKLLLVVAFASCIVRHINYYKRTKRIY